MGIPLLYPWANRLERRDFSVAGRAVSLPPPGTEIGIDEHGLPLHGVQPRLMRWQAARRGPTLHARLDWSTPELLAIFPFAHSVSYLAQLRPGPELEIAITVVASHGEPVPVAFGLHPYLRCPGADEVELPECDRLGLDGRGLPDGTSERFGPGRFPLDRDWDDALRVPASPARFRARDRTVAFLAGFGYGQVFSPREAGFVCFEPMTAPANALCSGEGLRVLEAGARFEARFSLACGEVS